MPDEALTPGAGGNIRWRPGAKPGLPFTGATVLGGVGLDVSFPSAASAGVASVSATLVRIRVVAPSSAGRATVTASVFRTSGLAVSTPVGVATVGVTLVVVSGGGPPPPPPGPGPGPPQPIGVQYAVVITDQSGNEVNWLPPWNLQLTRRIQGPCDGQVDVLHTGNLTGLVNYGGVKVYRNGALVFFGMINGRTRKKHALTLKFADPLFWLQKRSRLSTYTITIPGKTGPQGVSDMITAENTRAQTHLRMGALAGSSVYQSYTVQRGTQVAQAIDDLANVSGGFGFWYKVDPVVSGGAVFAQLNTATSSGTDRPGIRFEYGDGTLGNIGEDWQESEGMPITHVRVWGQPADGSGYKVGKPFAEATSAVTSYGLIDDDYQADIANPSSALMQAIAQGYLIPSPPLTWEVHPVPNNDQRAVQTPRPWTDFDAGDTVRLTIHDGNYTLNGKTARVTEFTVTYDDNAGAENVSTIGLEEPIVGNHARAVPSPGRLVTKFLTGVDKRLRQLEREPQ